MAQQERWRNVIGFEGDYIVSDLGRVMSLPRRANHVYGSRISEGRILRTNKLHSGYLQVTLCKDGTRKQKLVHRLVAEAFIPNPKELPQVNHKDFDRAHNEVSNLEWCTPSENALYSENVGRLYHERTRVIRDDGIVFESVSEAADSVGVDSTTVSVALLKKKVDGSPRTAGGHTFSYV